MQAVMLSVQPQWCELIASGKKTLEVRKTRPKLETPFKCYIYCTKPKNVLRYVFGPEDYEGIFPHEQISSKKVFCKTPDGSSPFCSAANGNSKVIGEFVCDSYIGWSVNPLDGLYMIFPHELRAACLTGEQFTEYGDGKTLYGWHISALQMYDKPRELSEFSKHGFVGMGLSEYVCANRACENYVESVDYDEPPECKICGCQLTSPPQSWFYVEEARP